MKVDFEVLEQIPKLLEVMLQVKSTLETNSTEKRWLNTKELAEYTGYKLETIKAKIKKNDFVLGTHYYKREGKLLFDKSEVDNWVMGIDSVNNSTYTKIDALFEEVLG
ncbi:helix-turn-helix domain-containing protein [Sulfurimonas sp. HSL3-7]|uniref:helix-turn-helix transcriptional regulator n=1 Tax=Sulfonitrofixus jiaomeiensis TaxID=3131938 RepID=UPI0031F96B35